ncbi:MAG: hypothetical protein F4X98_00325 [Gammaproteobacteria bacterium]|nr:hypothetical protein [Gammaproteobacteria bacterium]
MTKSVDSPHIEPAGDDAHTDAKARRTPVAVELAFDRRARMIRLVGYAGTCAGLMTVRELHVARRRD